MKVTAEGNNMLLLCCCCAVVAARRHHRLARAKKNATLTLFRTPPEWLEAGPTNFTSALAEELLLHYASVDRLFAATQFDLVYFHEPMPQQRLDDAAEHMPRARFIEIEDFMLPWPESKDSPWCRSKSWREDRGYKSMCAFWFYRAWFLVKGDYEYALRVDSDIRLWSLDWPDFPGRINSLRFRRGDAARYTKGMHAFFKANFSCLPDITINPYTNLMLVDLSWATTHPTLLRVYDAVEQSNCILINRWGDMPLWGMAMAIFHIVPRDVIVDGEYFHASHHKNVSSAQTRSRNFLATSAPTSCAPCSASYISSSTL